MLDRLGRVCYRRRRLIVCGWLIATVGFFLVGYRVFDRFTFSNQNTGMESLVGLDRIAQLSGYGPRVSAVVDGRAAADPQVRDAVQSAAADLTRRPDVGRVLDPYDMPGAGLVTTDGRTVLVHVDLVRGLSSDAAGAAVDAVSARLGELRTATGATVHVGGSIVADRAFADQSRRDTQRAELVALPLALLVMVVVFAGLVAASLPVLAAVVSVGGGLAALYGFSYLIGLDPSTPSVTSILGLGVCIDYALLLVTRYREERARGLSAEDAIARTTATAGRTVAWSAAMVTASVSGLLAVDIAALRGFALAALSVLLVALAVALTLVPALLATVPTGSGAATTDDGVFARLARGIRRVPVATVVLTAAVLVVAGLPFGTAQFRLSGVDALPVHADARQYERIVAARFPSEATDLVTVLVHGPLQRLTPYVSALERRPDVAAVGQPVPLSEGWSVITVRPTGASQGPGARQLVRDLRAHRPDFVDSVTGTPAILVDYTDEIRRALPWTFGWIVVVVLVMLFLMTGSVLIPVKAIVMNVLSLGASFGVLVWVFQDGHGARLLGFTPTGGLEIWVPVLVFTLAFGVSMDYEVFLLSRMKEYHDDGLSNDEAVARGLQRSARVITSAALLMVIVFGAFATGETLGVKELGIALAVAVAVDATLIRLLLIPATMTLLGRWNWWAPAPLRRLHRWSGVTHG